MKVTTLRSVGRKRGVREGRRDYIIHIWSNYNLKKRDVFRIIAGKKRAYKT